MHRLHDLLVLLAGVLQPPEAPLVVEADAEAGHQRPPEHDGAPALGVQHAGEAGHDVTCAGLLLVAAHHSCHVTDTRGAGSRHVPLTWRGPSTRRAPRPGAGSRSSPRPPWRRAPGRTPGAASPSSEGHVCNAINKFQQSILYSASDLMTL